MKYLYNIETDYEYTPREFNLYASECACHADIPLNFPQGVPRSCALDYCSLSNTDTVYMDATSRTEPCKSVFCQAITQVGNLIGSEGGQVDFSNKISQTCPAYSSAVTTTPTTTTTTTTPTTKD